jgi:hypothetical protein
MKSFGSLLVILGLGTFVLNALGMEFKLLGWIDNWGATAGIAIRVGLVVVGAALWLLGRKREAAQPAQS